MHKANLLLRLWTVLTGALFVVAAATKVHDGSSIYGLLSYFGVERTWASPAFFALIGFEVVLGTILLLARPSAVAIMTTLVTLAGFTIFLAVLWSGTTAPDCGCLGKLLVVEEARTGHLIGIGRNLLLLVPGALLFGWHKVSSGGSL